MNDIKRFILNVLVGIKTNGPSYSPIYVRRYY